MKKYLVQFIISSLVLLTVFVAINWIVDPYWIYGSPEIQRFNSNKPYAEFNQRLYEIAHVMRNPPQALVIGSSREDSGIDPKHPAFQGRSVFNAAIVSQPFVESKEILQSLSEHGDFPKQVIFGLIFENANVFGIPLPADYSTDNFNELHRYKLLLGLSTLTASLTTVRKNLIGEYSFNARDGFRTPGKWDEQLIIGQRRAFKENEKHYLMDNHFPPPACKHALIVDPTSEGSVTPMQELRETIAIAYRMKSDMRLFIGPSHARQWETIVASGLWGQFEDWKRMLVDIVESEAIKAKAKPFQIWDFSGYNSITEEEVPSATDTKRRMRYYYESSHYTPAAGDLVLDRMFDLKSTEHTIPDAFGVLLTSKNIAAHLESIRVAREHYRLTHPEDIAEIEALAREVKKTKHCKIR